MKIQELLAFEDYKDGLKALYKEYDLTLGYETEEINEEKYKKDIDDKGYALSDSPQDRKEQIENNKFLKDTYGWDLTELWNLDETIFIFLLPRLYVFYKIDNSLEQEYEEGTFKDILETILEGLLIVLDNKYSYIGDHNQEHIISKSLVLLGKYIRRLWD